MLSLLGVNKLSQLQLELRWIVGLGVAKGEELGF